MPFHFLRQRDTMQCGIACLAMICRHHGLDIPFYEMEKYCPISKNGVSLLGLSDAAQKLGFTSIAGKYTIEQIRKIQSPCILHWNQNHFVVLYRIKRDKFYVADPAKGLMAYKQGDFCGHWIPQVSASCVGTASVGIAMVLTLNKDFCIRYAGGKNDTRILWKKIIRYFTCYRQYFLILGVGLVLNAILQLAMPFFAQSIVDQGIRKNSLTIIGLVLLGEMMIVFGKTISEFVQSWIIVHVSMRINVSMIYDFLSKLLNLPMSFFDSRLLGDLMQRMGDYGRVQSFIGGQLLGLLFSVISFAVLGSILFIYNLSIFAIFILCSIVYGLWILVFLRKRKILDYEFFEKQGHNSNIIYQLLSNMQEIKLQGCEERRKKEWVDAQVGLFRSQVKSMSMQQTQDSGSILINEVRGILITVFAATAVMSNSMTLGEMLAIQYIVGQLNSPVMRLIRLINSIQDVKISLDRINEIDALKNEDEDKQTAIQKIRHYGYRLDNVCFKYNKSSLKSILSDITLDIPEGKTTAIVGASGSGKTTLIKLLLGYYRTTCGNITLSGMNVNDVDVRWLRKQCGVIMQDGVIFSESIAQNIAVGDENVNMEEVDRAARIAEIHDFIMQLPMGYYTKIGRDGLGISQGQKQRILIARAVYKRPSVIIMDEATNSLDATTEKCIVSNLSKFLQGKTAIIVAHRLSTVMNADQIVVLDKGRIVECGNHATLLHLKGYYYDLIKNQIEIPT